MEYYYPVFEKIYPNNITGNLNKYYSASLGKAQSVNDVLCLFLETNNYELYKTNFLKIKNQPPYSNIIFVPFKIKNIKISIYPKIYEDMIQSLVEIYNIKQEDILIQRTPNYYNTLDNYLYIVYIKKAWILKIFER